MGTLLQLDGADNLSIWGENVSKMSEILEVLWVQGARIGLKINFKNTKSLSLGLSEDEQVILSNEKIDQVDSFMQSTKKEMMVETINKLNIFF